VRHSLIGLNMEYDSDIDHHFRIFTVLTLAFVRATTSLYFRGSNASLQFVRFNKAMLFTPFFFVLARGQYVMLASSTRVLTELQSTRAPSCLREKFCACTC
jgi:hypothetical protein